MHKKTSFIISILITFFATTTHAASTEDAPVAAGAASAGAGSASADDPFLKLRNCRYSSSLYDLPCRPWKEGNLTFIGLLGKNMAEITAEKYEEYKSNAPEEFHPAIERSKEKELEEDNRVHGALLAARFNPKRFAAMGDRDGSRNWVLRSGTWFPRTTAMEEGILGTDDDAVPQEDPITYCSQSYDSQYRDFAPLAEACLDTLEHKPLLRARILRESCIYYYNLEHYERGGKIRRLERALDRYLALQLESPENHREKLEELSGLRATQEKCVQKICALGLENEEIKRSALIERGDFSAIEEFSSAAETGAGGASSAATSAGVPSVAAAAGVVAASSVSSVSTSRWSCRSFLQDFITFCSRR